MHLAVWLVLSVIVSYALRHRPLVLVGVALTIWTMVPAAANPILVGTLAGSYSYKAASWFIFCGVSLQVLGNPRGLLEEIGRRFGSYLCLLLVIAEATLVTRMSPGKGGIVLLVDQVIAPVLMFLLVGVGLAAGGVSITLLRNWIVVLAATEAVFALVQFVAKSSVVYKSYYASLYFYHPATNTRWMGTTDSPLTLSLLLCVAVPFLAGLRRPALQLSLIIFMGAGVLTTESRTGLVAFAIGAIYVVLVSQMRMSVKYLTFLLLVAAGYLAAGSVIAAGVQNRIVNDTGSTLARSAAWEFFFSHWTDYFFSGDGVSSSYVVSKSAGLQSSFESSIIMYSIDIGIMFALLYFGVQAMLVLRSLGTGTPKGAIIVGLVLIIVPQTYSALAAESLAGPLLWVALSVITSGLNARVRAVDLGLGSQSELTTGQR